MSEMSVIAVDPAPSKRSTVFEQPKSRHTHRKFIQPSKQAKKSRTSASVFAHENMGECRTTH